MMKFLNFCEKKCLSLSYNEIEEINYNIYNYFQYPENNFVELDDIKNITSNYLLGFNVKNSIKLKLLLTKIQNKNYCIFILNNNGNLQYFHVKFRFDESLYNGTLFEGELVKNDKKCWVYYMSDIIYSRGQYLYNYRLKDRLKEISYLLKDLYTFDLYFNPCHLQLKSYFLFNHIHFLEKDCELLFIPEYSNMGYYKKEIIFPKTKKSLLKDGEIQEFIIKKTEKVEIYDLYTLDDEYDGFACVNSLKLSLYLRNIFKENESKKMECKYSTFFKSWIPIIS